MSCLCFTCILPLTYLDLTYVLPVTYLTLTYVLPVFNCILPLSYLDLTYVLSVLIRENSGRKTLVLPCPYYEMQEKLPRVTKGAAKGDSKVRTLKSIKGATKGDSKVRLTIKEGFKSKIE